MERLGRLFKWFKRPRLIVWPTYQDIQVFYPAGQYVYHSDSGVLLRAAECLTLSLTSEEAMLLGTGQMSVDKLIQRRTSW